MAFDVSSGNMESMHVGVMCCVFTMSCANDILD